MTKIDGLPVMYCRVETIRGGTVWTFGCPHCRRRHTHSAEPGHRVAHCTDPTSPYAARGYVLVLQTNSQENIHGNRRHRDY
jgi:hypothetical protein